MRYWALDVFSGYRICFRSANPAQVIARGQEDILASLGGGSFLPMCRGLTRRIRYGHRNLDMLTPSLPLSRSLDLPVYPAA